MAERLLKVCLGWSWPPPSGTAKLRQVHLPLLLLKRRPVRRVEADDERRDCPMIRYRLCFINPNTNQIDREREIEANDDVDAIHIARESDHRPLEIWCEDRKVRALGQAAALHA